MTEWAALLFPEIQLYLLNVNLLYRIQLAEHVFHSYSSFFKYYSKISEWDNQLNIAK